MCFTLLWSPLESLPLSPSLQKLICRWFSSQTPDITLHLHPLFLCWYTPWRRSHQKHLAVTLSVSIVERRVESDGGRCWASLVSGLEVDKSGLRDVVQVQQDELHTKQLLHVTDLPSYVHCSPERLKIFLLLCFLSAHLERKTSSLSPERAGCYLLNRFLTPWSDEWQLLMFSELIILFLACQVLFYTLNIYRIQLKTYSSSYISLLCQRKKKKSPVSVWVTPSPRHHLLSQHVLLCSQLFISFHSKSNTKKGKPGEFPSNIFSTTAELSNKPAWWKKQYPKWRQFGTPS